MMKLKRTRKKILVPGFRFSGVSAGIKKGRRKDLALLCSDTEAAIAGVFTTNRIKAAPVKLDIARIASRKGQAIIVNSGNANACTGDRGLKNAEEMGRITARALGIRQGLVYVASTGIIGRVLPMPAIRKAIPQAVDKLSPRSLEAFASAITTTDTFTKIASRKIRVAGKTGTIAGVTKGAGMINPHMATMLCFVLTDVAIDARALDSALRGAVRTSFNRLTVDNDMSTNDTVLIMANGALGNEPIGKKSPFYRSFEDALAGMTYELSGLIAADGEGATKTIVVLVRGAKTESDAERAARAIAGSLLVKTAVYGRSPNWGRIFAALGYSGVKLNERRTDISINNCKLVSHGTGTHRVPRNLFARDEILITASLGVGKKSARIITCDLTEKYIRINAGYMS